MTICLGCGADISPPCPEPHRHECRTRTSWLDVLCARRWGALSRPKDTDALENAIQGYLDFCSVPGVDHVYRRGRCLVCTKPRWRRDG